MSLVIRQIAVDGFRKFRTPFAINDLSEGLNIVIEPNETGKSTLLEALRAAFFVRHNTRNQLAQSFAPYGEAEADARLAALERSFAELDASRGRLKIIQREITDDTDAQTRKALVDSLEVARAAAQILATRKAEQEAADAKLKGLEDLKRRHAVATASSASATAALEDARAKRAGLGDMLSAAKAKVASAREELDAARHERQGARAALAAGEEAIRQNRQRVATVSARRRFDDLLLLEQQHREAKALASTAIPAKTIEELEANDRAVSQAQAVLDAGATRLILSGANDGITIDGQPMATGERTITRVAHIVMGGAELTVSPPAAAASAEEILAAALRKRKAALDELEIVDLPAARSRNETARDAAAELRTLAARIDAVTPADDTVQIAAGAEALKLFIAGLGAETSEADLPLPDTTGLTVALDSADTKLARAEGTQDSAITALRRAEEEDAPAALLEAGAVSDLASAAALLQEIEARPEWASLDDNLLRARGSAAETAVRLEEAKRDASAHDVAAINRKIEVIDARVRVAAETRTRLETEIARLEGTIESEGGLGLADRAAAAHEEVEAANAALQRVTEEADTLKLLRDTLESARNETAAKFVGPVAKRAKRYIVQLLPDCDLTFSEDLTLASVSRVGVDESCANLSRGTQEQLSVLTRIAFADLLLEQGKPVSLILDDPLVYSDDGRLDTMIEILTEAATRMQIILLTCRDRAFRHVPGNRIVLGSGS